MSNGRPCYEDPAAYNPRSSYSQYKMGRISRNVGKQFSPRDHSDMLSRHNGAVSTRRPRMNMELNKGINSTYSSSRLLGSNNGVYQAKNQSAQLRQDPIYKTADLYGAGSSKDLYGAGSSRDRIYGAGNSRDLQGAENFKDFYGAGDSKDRRYGAGSSKDLIYGTGNSRDPYGARNLNDPKYGRAGCDSHQYTLVKYGRADGGRRNMEEQAIDARQGEGRDYHKYSSALHPGTSDFNRNKTENEKQCLFRHRQESQFTMAQPSTYSCQSYASQRYGHSNQSLARQDRQATVPERMDSEFYQRQSCNSAQTLRFGRRQVGLTHNRPQKQALTAQNTPSRSKDEQNCGGMHLNSQSTREQLISKSKVLRERMNQLEASAKNLGEPLRIRHQSKQASEHQGEDGCSRLQRLMSRPNQRRCDSPYRNGGGMFKLAAQKSEKYERAPHSHNSGTPLEVQNGNMRKINLFTQQIDSHPPKQSPQQAQQNVSNYEQLHSDQYMKKINSLSHRINDRINSIIHCYDR